MLGHWLGFSFLKTPSLSTQANMWRGRMPWIARHESSWTSALTSSALVFACPPRPHPPSGAPVSSTQVRSASAGSSAAAGWCRRAGGRPRAACRGLARSYAALFDFPAGKTGGIATPAATGIRKVQ